MSLLRLALAVLYRELFLILKAELQALILTSLVIQGFLYGKTQMHLLTVTFSTQHFMQKENSLCVCLEVLMLKDVPLCVGKAVL